ncbi:SRPBCC family protein [Bacteroidales bacterium OttesenSCG-928-M06]|nr:SRPBCC family protein [Bacteroidales bacterium OttesenSCG-928-M06]
MTEFTSEVKTLPYKQEKIYEILSNLDNLEKVKEKIPHDKIQDFSFDQNSCSFSVNPIGQVRFSIIEKEPIKTIKFKADQAPIDVNIWIQLVALNTEETKMKLTVKAELNPFLKPMLSKPLQEGIDKIAEALTQIPYDKI